MFISLFNSAGFYFTHFEAQSLGAFTFISSLMMMDTCFIHLSKTEECTPLRINPNVNYELWVIIVCQCRFINSDKYTILVGDVDNGGG